MAVLLIHVYNRLLVEWLDLPGSICQSVEGVRDRIKQYLPHDMYRPSPSKNWWGFTRIPRIRNVRP